MPFHIVPGLAIDRGAVDEGYERCMGLHDMERGSEVLEEADHRLKRAGKIGAELPVVFQAVPVYGLCQLSDHEAGLIQAAGPLIAAEALLLPLVREDDEAAMLAGIVKNPLKNSPLNSVENATERRNLVLKLMLEQGYIDESEYVSALRAEYTAPPEQKSDTASGSYANAAIYEAATILGSSVKEVITGGYTVITYCDTQAQELLKRAYDAESISVDGADKMFLLGDNSTSGVCAYVSGISYAPHEFRRQPASTIKPIMAYAPAFDTGIYSPSSPIEDKLYDFNGYSPHRFSAAASASG